MRNANLKRYERYALIGGVTGGLLLGVFIAGPNFHTWSAQQSVTVVLGCTLLCVTGAFLALSLFAGYLAKGDAPDSAGLGSPDDFTVEHHDFHTHDHHADHDCSSGTHDG